MLQSERLLCSHDDFLLNGRLVIQKDNIAEQSVPTTEKKAFSSEIPVPDFVYINS